MKSMFGILSLSAGYTLSSAFHAKTWGSLKTSGVQICKVSRTDKDAGNTLLPHFDFNAKHPDMERAKECVEHFGKCSISELQELKEEIHQQRLQHAAFGDPYAAPEDTLQQRFIEDELALQLKLLRDETPPAYLFTTTPPTTTDDCVDFNIAKDHVESPDPAARIVEEGARNQIIEEFAEEGVIDSLAICALIGLLMFAPQLLQ